MKTALALALFAASISLQDLPDWRFNPIPNSPYFHTGADRFEGQPGLPDSGLSYSTATRVWKHSR